MNKMFQEIWQWVVHMWTPTPKHESAVLADAIGKALERDKNLTLAGIAENGLPKTSNVRKPILMPNIVVGPGAQARYGLKKQNIPLFNLNTTYATPERIDYLHTPTPPLDQGPSYFEQQAYETRMRYAMMMDELYVETEAPLIPYRDTNFTSDPVKDTIETIERAVENVDGDIGFFISGIASSSGTDEGSSSGGNDWSSGSTDTSSSYDSSSDSSSYDSTSDSSDSSYSDTSSDSYASDNSSISDWSSND